jgi:hypothetical protein
VYRYVKNSPVNYTDPDGRTLVVLNPLVWIGIGIIGWAVLASDYQAWQQGNPSVIGWMIDGKCLRPLFQQPQISWTDSTRPQTPAKGEPGSTVVIPTPTGKTVREYGPDGKAVKDIDYGHDHGAGDSHVHDWDWTGPKSIRGPGRPPRPGEVQMGATR